MQIQSDDIYNVHVHIRYIYENCEDIEKCLLNQLTFLCSSLFFNKKFFYDWALKSSTPNK